MKPIPRNPKRASQPLDAAPEVLQPDAPAASDYSLASKAATVAVVGAGVALIEAELLPGMLIGVAALLVPSLLPRLGRMIKPALKSTLRTGYRVAAKTKETVAEASQQVMDLAAEAKAEAVP